MDPPVSELGMKRIWRMLNCRTGKIPKDISETSKNGFTFRLIVQDDRELDWFKNIFVLVIKDEDVSQVVSNKATKSNPSDDKATETKITEEKTNEKEITHKNDTEEKSATDDLAGHGSNLGKHLNSSPAQTLDTPASKRSRTENGSVPVTNDSERINAELLEVDSSDDGDDLEESENEEDNFDEYEDMDDFDCEEWESEDEDERKAIGHCSARLIRRGAICDSFWENLEEPSQDTMSLAFEVFDRYGYLRPEFVEGYRKGSGVWGSEMNRGNFLQIERISIEPAYRRRGFSFEIIKQLHAKAQALDGGVSFSFAWPTQLNSEIRDLSDDDYKERQAQGEDAAIAAFRKSGYRRIGTTNWFAFAFDKEHASHRIAVADDYDRTEFKLSPLQEFLEALERKRTQRPHGFGTMVMSDKFRGFSNDEIEKIFELSGETVPEVDSPVYLRTKFGCTCGECLGGFISPLMQYTLLHQAAIKHDMLEDLSTTLRELDVDMPNIENENSILLPSGLEFLPKDVRPFLKSNKSVARGYCAMFQHVVSCLERPAVPSINNIIRTGINAGEWPPVTKSFLEKGDPRALTVAVLDALFADSSGQDMKAGDGMFFWGIDDEVFLPGIDDLPGVKDSNSSGSKQLRDEYDLAKSKPCRNDSEFRFVFGVLTEV